MEQARGWNEKAELHFLTTVTFATLDDLVPHVNVSSSRYPYDYAVMTPDYTWHYYQAYETEWGIRHKSVNITGEELELEATN